MKIIDADKTYMYPDQAPLREWFDEYNGRFFGKELPPIELKVVYGHKHTLGAFSYPERKPGDPIVPEKCRIEFNCRFFKPEDEWRDTMVHEMAHYYVYLKYGTQVKAHGKEFQSVARRINASSAFRIQTFSRELSFRPKPSVTDRWGERFDQEIILGSYNKTYLEDYVDEDTFEVTPVERVELEGSFSFRTKRCYIPEIIDNMRNIRGQINWFQVDECCQKLFLLPVTTAVPSFRREDIYRSFVEEADLLDDFGPVKWTPLGTTEFRDDGVREYAPGHRNESFRQKYFRDAAEIGRLAADLLLDRYRRNPRWFTSTVHGTYSAEPVSGEYTVQVDSRFKPLVAMTKKKILVNPVHSDLMMDCIRKEDPDKLAGEIARVILSRQ